LPDSFEVEPRFVSRATKAQKVPDPIVAIQPHSGFVAVTGFIRELIPAANPFKIFKVEDTVIGRALLAPLGKPPFGKVTVHAPRVNGQLESYTAWMPTEWISNPRISKGLSVALVLKGVEVAGREKAWSCVAFVVIG
jgi:hypothetical protein